MAPRLQWSVDLVTDEFIVPRLEDHLIDELFYQEDEIGEFRHTAFMVECGLEEDPPDGPDVPPLLWGDMLLKQQREKERQQEIAVAEDKNIKGSRNGGEDRDRDSDSDSDTGVVDSKGKREPPSRSRSTDDIDTLAIELTSTQNSHRLPRPPKRTNSTPMDLYAVDMNSSSSNPYVQFSSSSPGSGSSKPRRIGSKEIRRPEKRTPSKSVSDAGFRDRGLRSPEIRPKRTAPVRGKLTQTRSGTCHEMATAAARAREKMNSGKNVKNNAPAYRKLTKTHSGTCHEMATAAAKARKKLNSEKTKNKPEIAVPSTTSVTQRRKSIESIDHKESGKGARPAPLIRSLVATKSGTMHGARKSPRGKEESNTSEKTEDDENETSPKIVYKNGKRTAVRRISSISKESRLKSKLNANANANDSGSDKKIVYRNGKKERMRRHNSLSDSSISDDQFLGDIVQDSDDNSVARSEISISTCGSDMEERNLSPRKDRKYVVQSLKIPERRRSLTKKEDIVSSYPSSPRSIDAAKKKKKKKKKNRLRMRARASAMIFKIRKRKKRKRV